MNEPFAVPAQSPKGGVVYQYIYAGEVFTEDKWVVAAELRPTARAVVHHVIVFVLRPGQKVSLLKGEFNSTADAFGALFMTGRDLPQQLVGYAPGSNDWVAQPGEAKKIPKGSRLVMELHYTPNGQAVTDRTEVALKYDQGPPKHEIFVETAMNTYFRIPPKVSDYKVEAEHRFRNDFMLTSMFPHMHLRGKSFDYKLITPDGKEEILLSVPKYDFNWQQGFALAKPKLVPKRSRLVCTATYDNSEKNPFNPDPTKAVSWGDQTGKK